MKKIVLYYLLATALIACNSNKNEQQNTIVNSTEAAADISHEDSSLLFKNNGAEWFQGAFQLPGLTWKNIELENFWINDSLEVESFSPSIDFYRDYAPVLRWSPDSSYVLDIGSYGLIAIKDDKGKTTLEGGEPDTEISVLYPNKNEKARLLFAGPSSHIIDAKWIDKTQAIIIGTFELEDNLKEDTLMWMVDVKEQFFRLYNFKQQR